MSLVCYTGKIKPYRHFALKQLVHSGIQVLVPRFLQQKLTQFTESGH